MKIIRAKDYYDMSRKAAVKGAITPNVQASVLQLHNDVTIVADQEACSLLGD